MKKTIEHARTKFSIFIQAGLLGMGLFLFGCTTSDHPTQNQLMGVSSSSSQMEKVINQPGPIEFQAITAADWQVSLAGLVNFDHPKAKESKLKDKLLPIHIYTYLLKHPTHGYFLIDTGLSEKLFKQPKETGINALVLSQMNWDKMILKKSTEQVIAELPTPLSGVFLTHAHLDHISGVPALPPATKIYTGPMELRAKYFINLFINGTTNRILEKIDSPIQELEFKNDPDNNYSGVVDVFGDQSLFAIHVPGHTDGSLAFVIRTTEGPVLVTGDTCHTAWGWNNEVEPGDFTRNHENNRKNLILLKNLSKQFPNMKVKLGHQDLSEVSLN